MKTMLGKKEGGWKVREVVILSLSFPPSPLSLFPSVSLSLPLVVFRD